MSQKENELKLEKLKSLFIEMFQFDNKDLDFGIYHLMMQMRKPIENFLDKDLSDRIKKEFKNSSKIKMNKIEEELKTMRENICEKFEEKESAIFDSNNQVKEETEFASKKTVKEYKEKFEELKALKENEDTGFSEGDIYSAVFNFFDSYYRDGDFLKSKGNNSIYNEEGGEVLFSWSTKDQYYIKSGKDLSNYSFETQEDIQKQFGINSVKFIVVNPEFKYERQGGKDSKDSNYVLQFGGTQTISLESEEEDEDNGEKKEYKTARLTSIKDKDYQLQLFFEYTLKNKTEGSVISETNLESIKNFLENPLLRDKALKSETFSEELKKGKLVIENSFIEYLAGIFVKHFNKWNGELTSDFFIHKDLRGFLTKELDIFCNNILIRDKTFISSEIEDGLFKEGIESGADLLTDENVSTSILTQRISKIKLIRSICVQVIEFLSRIEEFQKTVWLKKSLINKTEYCITLDRIPESSKAQIVDFLKSKNAKEQIAEWRKMKFINEEEKVTIEFLESNKKLVVDTRYFPIELKELLIGSFDNLDEQLDGLLIKSDNFAALNFLQEKYKESIDCIYIDPPYNTGSDGFLYKDGFSHSSWLSMMSDRMELSKELMKNSSGMFVQLDKNEEVNIALLGKQIFGKEENILSKINVKVKNMAGASGGGEDKGLKDLNEQIFLFNKENFEIKDSSLYDEYPIAELDWINVIYEKGKVVSEKEVETKSGKYKLYTRKGEVTLTFSEALTRSGLSIKNFIEKYKQEFYSGTINAQSSVLTLVNENTKEHSGLVECVYTVSTGQFKGKEKSFYYFGNQTKRLCMNIENKVCYNGEKSILYKSKFGNNWTDVQWNGIAKEGKVELKNGKKPEKLIQRILQMGLNRGEIVLDFFVGSGTTTAVAHKMGRKWIGVTNNESNIFEDITLPRMKHVLYGEQGGISRNEDVDWQGGGFFQYIELEQYEEVLDSVFITDEENFNGSINEAVYTLGRKGLLQKNVSFLNDEEFIRTPLRYGKDLIETFNFLMGIKKEKVFYEENYARVDGKIGDKEISVVWFKDSEAINEKEANEVYSKIGTNRDIYTNKVGGNLEEFKLQSIFSNFKI